MLGVRGPLGPLGTANRLVGGMVCARLRPERRRRDRAGAKTNHAVGVCFLDYLLLEFSASRVKSGLLNPENRPDAEGIAYQRTKKLLDFECR